ncbi:unannotated protein [freshwater metagenome]|uniref:Unannotated protein n=1 Tax=freshwater metagenome TaxID=449393 RepID=A0A6J6UDD2_9ZZZZ
MSPLIAAVHVPFTLAFIATRLALAAVLSADAYVAIETALAVGAHTRNAVLALLYVFPKSSPLYVYFFVKFNESYNLACAIAGLAFTGSVGSE